MNYNKVMYAGRLARDPVLRYLPSNAPICEFTVVTNRKYKDAQGVEVVDTCYVDCVAYAKTAAHINQFFTKGKPIFLEGRLKYESWEKDGVKRSKLVLVVERWEFVGPPQAGDSADRDPPHEDAESQAPKRGAPAATNSSVAFKSDDVPF